MQTVRFAAALLRGPSSYAYPTVTLPATLQTLGHSTSRAAYLRMLRDLPMEKRRRMMIELVNLDEGTPVVRVAEAVSALRGACRGVGAFTHPTRRALAVLRNSHLTSVTVNMRALAKSGGDITVAIARFAQAAHEVAPIVALRGEMAPDEWAAARDSGVIYAIDPADRSRARAAAA